MAFEIFQSEKTGKYHFRLKARNHQIVLSKEADNQNLVPQNGVQSIITLYAVYSNYTVFT